MKTLGDKKVKFDDMGLYTLASLYLDCCDYNGTLREIDKKLAGDILKYVNFVRKDSEADWLAIKDKVLKIRQYQF